jgi:hypothetical protein
MELKSIKISKEIHKKLRIFCIENDLSIKDLIELLIQQYIEKK